MTKITKTELGTHFTRVYDYGKDDIIKNIQHTLPSYDFEYDGIPLVLARPLVNDKFTVSQGWIILEPTTGILLTDRNFGTIENTIAVMKRQFPSTTKLQELIQTAIHNIQQTEG